MRTIKTLAAALALAAPGLASAAQFRLVYTTTVDATSGPAVTLDAILTTDDGEFYPGNGYQVLSAIGTRGSQGVSFDNTTFNDEIHFPGDPTGNVVDSFGLDLVAGGIVYNFYKNGAGDFAYHEFATAPSGNVGRIVMNQTVSLTRVAVGAVPEPATWGAMLLGFGMIGAAARRRGRAAALRHG